MMYEPQVPLPSLRGWRGPALLTFWALLAFALNRLLGTMMVDLAPLALRKHGLPEAPDMLPALTQAAFALIPVMAFAPALLGLLGWTVRGTNVFYITLVVASLLEMLWLAFLLLAGFMPFIGPVVHG